MRSGPKRDGSGQAALRPAPTATRLPRALPRSRESRAPRELPEQATRSAPRTAASAAGPPGAADRPPPRDRTPDPPPVRDPNKRLGDLLTHAGVSNAGLARRVNDLGAASGLALRYDKTSVARWVGKGMTPQGPVPHLIAAVLAERLGRPVPLEEIGLGETGPTDPDLGLSFPRDLAEAVVKATDLWRHDHVNRRDFLTGTFAVTAFATPLARWLIAPADALAEHRGTDRRVGRADVAKLREAADEARRWDSKYGGGDWRASMVPECLRVEATPLLRGSYPDEVGRELFGATAELSRLAGWMAFDTGQHEIAQRYYIQALRLARGAADVPLGGYILATMSLQATYRGHPQTAVDLAQAAVERNEGVATSKVTGFLHLVEARAHARAGDALACAASLNAAESRLERARPGDEDPEWIDFFSYDRLCADGAECYRDLRLPEQTRRFTATALAGRSDAFARSHGLRLAVGAQADLAAGDVDAACGGGMRALAVAERVHSARNTAYIRDLVADLRRSHARVPAVREFSDHVRGTLGTIA
ncbi:MFS transporter [Yinghuangia sp. ASG 101]|uniref:MFS transporter n=1 Tax=Yinghuangia sp. ASG 101 TaxID=2896848 RepID=UPI001E4BC895|nr:MFS transporter [Yinghuangia sp. ASG 101]UGQ14945.1 MFS transporter [Yinghuangia sp. ASG 101]